MSACFSCLPLSSSRGVFSCDGCFFYPVSISIYFISGPYIELRRDATEVLIWFKPTFLYSSQNHCTWPYRGIMPRRRNGANPKASPWRTWPLKSGVLQTASQEFRKKTYFKNRRMWSLSWALPPTWDRGCASLTLCGEKFTLYPSILENTLRLQSWPCTQVYPSCYTSHRLF